MSTDDILAGLGIVIVLALGAQLVAARTRLPAIVLLLPAGFIAGAATDKVHPDQLFGNTFQPLVSLGVGVILFEAGLRLKLDELRGGVRTVVMRLVTIGVLVTAAGVAVASKLIFGLPWGPAAVLGAILVVSGPTVVLPLLSFVRPSANVRSTLKWEGVLIDPIGALLGVLVFHVVKAGGSGGDDFHAGHFAGSMGIGLVVGAVGAAVLWALMRGLQRASPALGILAALMVVTAALVSADLVRDDSGFVAVSVMGVVLGNQRRFDISQVLEFQNAVVSIVIGVLFVLISASVTPSQVSDVLAEGIALIAVMAFVIRPLVVAFSCWSSQLTPPERVFIAWLAPRGIVAAATASVFGPQLASSGVAGANEILPIAFVVIFGTVVLYGLTAVPVARALGVAHEAMNVVLIVGAHAWARAMAQALKAAGLGVRLWTGRPEEQEEARKAGLDAGNAQLGTDLASREAELEEITDALLLTGSDDFNALAAYELRRDLGTAHVYRLPEQAQLLALVPEYARGAVLFGWDMTYAELARRFEAGGRIVSVPAVADSRTAGKLTPLFVVTAGHELRVATPAGSPPLLEGDLAICLAEAAVPDGALSSAG